MSRGADWIVFNMKNQKCECTRCGASLGIVFPCRVTDFCNAIDSFTKEHKMCQESPRG